MDLAINNLGRLVCHKTQPTNRVRWVWYLGYLLNTSWVHLLSVDLKNVPDQVELLLLLLRDYVFLSACFPNYIALDVFTQRYSRNEFP